MSKKLTEDIKVAGVMHMTALGKTIVVGTLAFGAIAVPVGSMLLDDNTAAASQAGNDASKQVSSVGQDWNKSSNDLYKVNLSNNGNLASSGQSDDWGVSDWNWGKNAGGSDYSYGGWGNHGGRGGEQMTKTDHATPQHQQPTSMPVSKPDYTKPEHSDQNHDQNRDKWGHEMLMANHKSVEASQSYSAKTSSYEKESVALEYNKANASSAHDQKWGKEHGGKGGWGGSEWGNQSSKEHEDMTALKASYNHEKSEQAAIDAKVSQATIINNYTYINGNNNVVNNNISVNNSASVTQTASSHETTNVNVDYATASKDKQSDSEYAKQNYGKGGEKAYGSSSDSSNASSESLKYAASSEKSQTSEVTASSSYKLDESNTQSSNGGGHGDHEYAMAGYKSDEDCE